jgi:hypothetical protein
VEQILPCTERGPDPRDFYASDSPVLDDYFDSGQDSYKSAEEFFECVDPEVQVESSIACDVWFFLFDPHPRLIGVKHSQQPQVLPREPLLTQPQSFAPSSQTTLPSSSRQTLPLQSPTIPAALPSYGDNGPSVSPHRDIASGGHSTRTMSSSDPRRNGQLESRTNVADNPGQIVNSLDRTQGQRSGGNDGQRIRKRRGRSPRHRGADKCRLDVSSRRL